MSEKDALLLALNDLKSTPDRLVELLLGQAEYIGDLTAQVDTLTAQVEKLTADNKSLRRKLRLSTDRDSDLRARLEEVERTSHRQAAPFRIPKEKRVKEPKRSGQKKGHKGFFRSRPEWVDETVETPLDRCPYCDGEVGNQHTIEQFIEDLPPVRPHVTKVVTHEGRCKVCGRRVRSRHPL